MRAVLVPYDSGNFYAAGSGLVRQWLHDRSFAQSCRGWPLTAPPLFSSVRPRLATAPGIACAESSCGLVGNQSPHGRGWAAATIAVKKNISKTEYKLLWMWYN